MLTTFIMGILAGWLLEWVFYTFYWKNRKASGDENSSLKPKLNQSTDLVAAPAIEEKAILEAEKKPSTILDTAKAEPVTGSMATPIIEEKAVLESEKKPSTVADTTKAEPVIEGSSDDKSESLSAETIAAVKAEDNAEMEISTNVDVIEPPEAKDKEPVESKPTTLELEPEVTETATNNEKEAVAVLDTSSDVAKTAVVDDLTKLAGIGPKVAERLQQMGVSTYDELAKKDLNEVLTNLSLAGVRINKAASQTWTKQAALAAKQDWSALDDIKTALKK